MSEVGETFTPLVMVFLARYRVNQTVVLTTEHGLSICELWSGDDAYLAFFGVGRSFRAMRVHTLLVPGIGSLYVALPSLLCTWLLNVLARDCC
jgi:hypothetical protein